MIELGKVLIVLGIEEVLHALNILLCWLVALKNIIEH